MLLRGDPDAEYMKTVCGVISGAYALHFASMRSQAMHLTRIEDYFNVPVLPGDYNLFVRRHSSY